MTLSRRILLSAAAAVLLSVDAMGADPEKRLGGSAPLPRNSLFHIERPGADPAVVFVHGWTQSSIYWADWVQLLGRCGVHALAVDLPGFGRSSDLPGPYRLENLADAVAAFIRERRLGRVTLVGGSMGSTVAQFVALRHPNLVQRLVLAATSPEVPRRAPATQPANASAERYRDPRTANQFFYKGHPPDGYAEQFYATLQQMKLEAAVESAQSNGDWSNVNRLHEIKVPTLVIQGQHDTGKTPEQGARVVKLMPNARMVVLPDAAHSPQWDNPEGFRQAALPFIMEGATRGLRCPD